jgi:putative DNA primase/helicase
MAVRMANIKQIAQAALASVASVLNQWCPGGRMQGREYVALNPTRSDSKAGSFSINLDTGVWKDFATGDNGGDLVALVAYVDDVKQGEAAHHLAVFLGMAYDKQHNSPPAIASQNKRANTQQAFTSTKKQAADGYSCVMPVPKDAPKPPLTHSRHGKPTIRYTYLSRSNEVNFYHDRFEPKTVGERKQFAPLTYWVNGSTNKGEWRYKAPPNVRPLYGLPGLQSATRPEVWIAEGEKATDALAALLPGAAVLSWQGGAQAVSKADFSPLDGRDVVVWPDNDDAGKQAAEAVRHVLVATGAKSVQMLDISQLIDYLDEHGYKLQAGDDAYDLKSAGFSLDDMQALADNLDKLCRSNSPPAAQDVAPSALPFKRHFMIDDAGVYLVDVTPDYSAYKPPRWICDKLEVLALSRSPLNGEWGSLVSFKDRDQVQHRFIIPARSFNGEGLDATGQLYENGLTIAPKARALVLEYLQQENPAQRVRVTSKTGWHGEGDAAVFVLPQGAIGDAGEEWIYDSQQPNATNFKRKSTLEAWRDNVAALCVGNSRLVFAVSIAFAAPLRNLMDIKDLGGFHYRGQSSDGKSTALRLCGSVCGGPDYMQRWRATDNGLEALAMQHCDAPLLLDELKQLDPKTAGEAAYMLANGSGKARSNEKGGARKAAQWRLIFLSAGEVGLSQHMLEANKRVHAGQEIRMADIPADAGANMGIFENLHGHANGNEFAKVIAREISQHYGVAFPAFVEWVIDHREDVTDKLHAAINGFDKGLLSDAASGQARRVASIFALVGAAGELASMAGMTGWQQGEAFKAAKTCFLAWLQGFGGEGSQEHRAQLAQVRLFLEQHGEGRFADLDRNAVDDTHAARVMTKAGYRKHDKVALQTEYWVYPEVFKTEVCKGFDHKAIIRLLIDMGYMHKGDADHIGQPKRDLPEGKRRVYQIYGAIFEDGNE